jgi:putative aldouronate transport system substrate-binding protein
VGGSPTGTALAKAVQRPRDIHVEERAMNPRNPDPSSRDDIGRQTRRNILKGTAGAGALALTGRLTFPVGAAAQGATPAATPVAPPGLTAGVNYYPSPAEGVPEAYETFPEPFRTVAEPPGNGGPVSIFQITFNPPIARREQNSYWLERERRLGVSELQMTFAPSDTYEEQLATLTAGGELRDLMYLDLSAAPAHNETIQQGAYTDLTPYVTGDALQAFPNLARLPDFMWTNSAINGTNWGIPRSSFTVGSWISLRQDWADKVGIPEPRNAEDLSNLLVAFSTEDPDGNGRADTYGLATAGAGFGIDQFQYMFRVPNDWRLNDDGTLTNAIETEEYRKTVEFARRLFEAGAYHPDVPALTGTQVSDAFVSGQVGATVGGRLSLPGGNGLRVATNQVFPDAKVVGLVVPGHDGGPPMTHLPPGYLAITAIPAAVGRDEDRLQELLRILNFYAAPFGSEEHVFSFFGIDGVHSIRRPDGSRERTEMFREEILDFPNLVTYPPAYYFDRPGDAREIQGLSAAYVANAVPDPTLGLYSPTSVEQGPTLGQLVEDTVTSIVTGREPLDALDRMVQDWRSRGGDEVREEYQELLAARS